MAYRRRREERRVSCDLRRRREKKLLSPPLREYHEHSRKEQQWAQGGRGGKCPWISQKILHFLLQNAISLTFLCMADAAAADFLWCCSEFLFRQARNSRCILRWPASSHSWVASRPCKFEFRLHATDWHVNVNIIIFNLNFDAYNDLTFDALFIFLACFGIAAACPTASSRRRRSDVLLWLWRDILKRRVFVFYLLLFVCSSLSFSSESLLYRSAARNFHGIKISLLSAVTHTDFAQKVLKNRLFCRGRKWWLSVIPSITGRQEPLPHTRRPGGYNSARASTIHNRLFPARKKKKERGKFFERKKCLICSCRSFSLVPTITGKEP